MSKVVSRTVFAIVLLALTFSIARTLASPPMTDAGVKERDSSARTVGTGNDPHAPLGDRNSVAGNAVIEPADRETKVAPSVAGRIASIAVREGDQVEAGALLVELENAPLKAALAAAEADVAVSKADYDKAVHGQRHEEIDAAMDDAASAAAKAASSSEVLERMSKLVPGVSTTTDELERAKRTAESDRKAADAADARRRATVAGSRAEDILAARARWLAAQARRDQAAATLAQTEVRAPIAGQILQLKMRAGEYVTPGGADPLLIIGDTRQLRARIDVDERDIERVHLGASAFVIADAAPDKRRTGKVVDIGRRMGRKNVRTDDPRERLDTKILEVVVALDDKAGLVPGQRVTGYIADR